MKLPTCVRITADFLIVVHNENFPNAKMILSYVFENVPVMLRHTDVYLRTHLSLKTDIKFLCYW